jgi:amino-acid N-acetyltransferase
MERERTPPDRVRLTGLQEAQLSSLIEAEEACAAMYRGIGVGAAEAPARTVAELVALTRDHDVHVAEADYVAAGYVAWRDEPPGVAYITAIAVDPSYQRFGIGGRLLEAVRDGARRYGIGVAIVRVVERAAWAVRFFQKQGFRRLGDDAPEEVQRWRSGREASGEPAVRPGEVLMWAAIGLKAEEPEDDEPQDEPTWDGGTGI